MIIFSKQSEVKGLVNVLLSVRMAQIPDGSDFECGTIIGAVGGDFHTLGYLKFSLDGLKNKTHPGRISSVAENTVLMREVRRE